MTELIFQYSGVYDRMLAKLTGEKFDDKCLQEGSDFEKKIGMEWKKYNNKVFKYYKNLGFQLPDFWLAYAVHPWKDITPFSSPLTIIIHDGSDKIISTVIHELCHVFISYHKNKKASMKLWQHIIKSFPNKNRCTQEHLIVIPLARSGVYYVFGKSWGEA